MSEWREVELGTLTTKIGSGATPRGGSNSYKAIKDIEIIVPPMKLQQDKGQAITDLYLRKENNDKQIRTLESLRDTLLPKLMSGEIQVAL